MWHSVCFVDVACCNAMVTACRVDAICVLNHKKVFEDKSYARVSKASPCCLVSTAYLSNW